MRCLLRSLVVCTFAGTTLLAQTDQAGTGWTPVLELRVMSATPQGTTANQSSPWKLVKAGDPIAAEVATGATLCSVAVSSTGSVTINGAPAATMPQSNIWKVTGEFLGEQAGRYAIRVTSGFTRLAGREPPAATTQTLSLREGDNVVLDALTGKVDGACQVHAVTMDARVVLKPADPALARTRYTADLWLVHTNPDGQEQRERLIANVDGSASVPFMFNRLSFPVPVVDPQQGDADAFIQLTGALRARPRADGLVDVDVDTNRIVYGMERPDRSSGFTGPMTRKTLTLKVEETTAIEFPPPSSGFVSVVLGEPQATGRISVIAKPEGQSQPSASGPAIEVIRGRLVLHTDRFFKGHRTQLLVRLRLLK